MNSDFTGKWNEISERGHGAGRFRVCPDHLLDLFIGFSVAGEREFTLESSTADFKADEIPAFENIDVQLGEVRGTHSLTLRLTDRGLTDLFSNICSDLANASSVAGAAEGAIRIFVVRLSRWAELLRRRRDHELSFNERLGLLGELSMLVWAIDECCVDAPLAIRGWRGPDGDSNDIGLNSVRIEVKAQHSTQRQSLKISSLDQLDWDSRNLFIAVNRFCSSDEGVSLGSLVSTVSSRLVTNSHGLMEFQRKLIVAGYDPDAGYVDETFKLEELRVYRVTESFPRLVPGNVPLGICKVKYEIACETISDFVIAPSELVGLIND
ncbi:PD-(D/E)XK motif protein [Pseudomonas sp. NY15181]|uniref:PD-(D/E)XK motif protein n=1 Tax=Pseudomonas sp. NY15181 TaxID=3400349 RepID=UPI003A877254